MVMGLSINITDDDNSLNLELALDVAEFFFALIKPKAVDIINQIKKYRFQKWRQNCDST